ncbi:NAD(P)-dependent oxidoreductase [Marinilabilia rubra]|uniref:Hydroxyacid dehydrogenase n=1 Tax=Marinilabilia rubra TaxID=2162893 RepID=A0A2U2B3G7_9BACT|nr:NAD(P)-dependent oxidoreductase [Marinilabilia rubra]PWD97577.1 hydroxyacid dehydrogenase [Marinilabilia rubra]
MKKKILFTHQLPFKPFSVLDEWFDFIRPQSPAFSRDDLIEYLPEADVVVSVFGNRFDSDLINTGSVLKLIANYGAGVDNIDLEEATKNGIVVTNTPDSVTEPTAELAMGLMVDIARRISELDRRLKDDNISSWGVMDNLSTTLYGKTLGIIGMGAIGRSLAKRARAFGMEIIYHNRNRVDSEIEEKLDARYTDIESLLRNSDFVSLNVPLTPDTNDLISISELKMMKSSAFLINTARGPVLNQEALIEALKNKEIAGAALDVFENEPEVPEQLKKMPNVVVSPHVGSGTYETREIMSKQVADIIKDFFDGMGGVPAVNSEVWGSSSLRVKNEING